MNTTDFKENFYLVRNYQRVSDNEFKCQIIVNEKLNNQKITGIETKINILEIGQGIADSRFSINPISWERFLNQTIIMLFNMLMHRLNIEDLYTIDGQEAIKEFFNSDPFHIE